MGSFPRNIARTAKDVFCAAYQAYPDWMMEPARQVGNPLVGIAQDLCRRVPPDSTTPEAPFKLPGGQCPTTYDARSRFFGVNNDGTNYDSGWSNWLGMTGNGPFSATTNRVKQTGTGLTVGVAQIRNSTGAVVFNTQSAGARSITDIQIETRRRDLAPDTCGPQPDKPFPVPPVGDLVKPVPVPTGNGLPIVLPFVVPVGVLLKPTIQINVGPFDVDINVGGVEINPTINLPGSGPRTIEPQPNGPQPPPLPPSRPPSNPGSQGGSCPDPCPDIDLDPVISRLELIKKYVRRPKTSLTVQGVGSGDSGSFTLPPKTRFVTVVVTSTPPTKRQQSGGSSGPDAYHQGWCAVGRGESYGERIPLSYLENCYVVPPGCDSFSFTMYSGGTAVVSAVVESDLQECQTYECG